MFVVRVMVDEVDDGDGRAVGARRASEMALHFFGTVRLMMNIMVKVVKLCFSAK